MTTTVPNVDITSGTTILADSALTSWNALEVAGSLNIPPTGQIWQEYGANIQRLNDRVFVGAATPSDTQPNQQSWLDEILGIGPNGAQLYVLSQSSNPAIVGGVQSRWPTGEQFSYEQFAGSFFGMNNDNYTPSAVPWPQIWGNASGEVVLNNGNLYVCTTGGYSWTSPSGPSKVSSVVGDGTVMWAHANAITWHPATAYAVNGLVSNAGNYYVCATAGTSASAGGPTGTGSSIADGTVIWKFQAALSASIPWQQSTAYNEYATVVNGTNYYICFASGTSAGPAGPLGTNLSIADGGVVWSHQSPSAWQASQAYSINSVATNGGSYYVCVTAGTSAASGGPTGTGMSIADGTAVWSYQSPAAWQSSHAYSVADVVVNGGAYYVCTTAGTSAGPLGPTGTGASITDGNAVWSYLRANYIPSPWQPSHAYSVNDIIVTPWNGGTTYICIRAGISAASGSGPSGPGGVIDGTVHWRMQQSTLANIVTTLYVESRHSSSALSQYTINSEMDIVVLPWAWQASHAYALNDIVTNGGNTYLCTAAGTSAGSGGPTGSGSSISDGTVTWAFSPGGSAWLPSTVYQLNSKVYNSTNLYVCVQGGMSAASGGPTGTGSSIVDGTVIWKYQPAVTPIGYIDPCLMYEQSKTMGLWLSNGRPDVASADATVAIGIINNAGEAYASSGRYSKGIVIDANAIIGTTAFSPGASCAIALNSGHHIQWFAPIQDAAHGYWRANQAYATGYLAYNAGNTYVCIGAGTSAAAGGPTGTGSPITDGTVVWALSQVGAAGGQVVAGISCAGINANQPSLALTDGWAAFTDGEGGPWLLSVVSVPNAAARVEAQAAVAGATPSLAAATWAGTESVDLALKAQRSGYLQLFTPSAQARHPAHFQATHQLAVKDASGTVYYLACSEKPW